MAKQTKEPKTNKVKNPKNKKRLNRRNLIKVAVALVVIFGLTVTGIFAYGVYKDTADFSASKLLSGEASRVYDKNGQLIYTYGSDENGSRQNVTYEDLPQVLVDAVISAEDSRFFDHNGFDLPRITRAFISNLTAGGTVSGGSTITQQLIKKAYFPKAEQTYTRKLSEVFLAIQADSELSKEEIITLYLNKIYFGRSTKSIGIAAASKYYFNKEVSDLTLPEAALLAGSLNSPYNYDPYYNLEKATNRRNTVLNLMVTHGYISQDECNEAKKVSIENILDDANNESGNEGYLAAYIDLVSDEVYDKTGYKPNETQMNIYTYCDPSTQKIAADLNNGVTYDYSDEDMQMSGSVQESQTGRIVAILGGRNYQSGNQNLATAKQQPGSSVKPFLDYGLAFEYLDWSTGHTVDDSPWASNEKYTPKNWDGNSHGKMLLSSALENSWNVPAVRTFNEVLKADDVSDDTITTAMESLGIDMSAEKEIQSSLAIGGWAKGISPYEMANVYGTIASNGVYREAHTVNYCEVVDTGEKFNIDEDINNAAKQSSLSQASAFMIREVMLDYTKNGSGNYRYLKGLDQIAGKTGTSNFSGSNYVKDGKSRDIWMTGYNPDYVCSVWMGFSYEGIKKGKNTSDYKAHPGEVVAAILKNLSSGGIKNKFPDQPDDVVQAELLIGSDPYKSPTASTASSKKTMAWFKKGTEPSESSTDGDVTSDLSNLSSFNASLSGDGNIAVNFAPYSPADAVTNGEYSEATKEFGTVVYQVDVTDGSGANVHSQTLSSPSATLDYKPTGDVTVTGYYRYANSSQYTSNKVNIVVGPGASQITNVDATVSSASGIVNNGATISDTSVNVTASLSNASNSCTIAILSGGSQLNSVNASAATFSNLTPGITYQIVITESNGTSQASKTVNFTVA